MHREVKDLAEAHTAADAEGPPLAMPPKSAPLLRLPEEAELPGCGGSEGGTSSIRAPGWIRL